jgi:hypothetical protein|tara:strand:+ start:156 stop:638 length:483 start_codon:yes stop_codon:yes gene_type:complete
MAKSKQLVTLIREMVKQEVQKEIREIFIREGIKSMTQKSSLKEDAVVEVLPKPKPKPKKEVSYTKNPVLNDILNETARAGEMDEYPTMGGGTYDTSKMAEAMGYGNMVGDAESRRKAGAIQTAQAAGADTNNKAVQDVMSNLTRDYRDVMKAVEEKGKNR